MSQARSRIPLLVWIIIVGVGLLILYRLVIFVGELMLYIGYNSLFFLDNLFEISPFNPVATWAVFGLIIGTIAGVAMAIKKFKLSKLLILYPLTFSLLLILVMYYVNKPANYMSAAEAAQEDARRKALEAGPAKEYYSVSSTARVRMGPANSKNLLFTVPKGAEVELLQRGFFDKNRTEWFLIKYNDQQGYVSGRLLRFSRKGY